MDYQTALEVFFGPAPADAATPDVVAAATPARKLRDALEPVAMHAVWSAEVNATLAERGLNFLSGYVCGRGAPLGEVPGAVVAATFAVFEPGLIGSLWAEGCGHIRPAELIPVRDAAATASLRAVLEPVASEAQVGRVAELLEQAIDGVDGAGRTLFSALRAQPRLADPYARLWRAADTVREHRGDSHIAACVAAGLDPVRMGVLSEVWVGYPVGEYSGTRAWPEEAHAAGVRRLEADGLLADGALTTQGRELRDGIEDATDAAQADLLDRIGGELDTAAKQLHEWSQRCVEAGAFPPDMRKRAAG